MPGMKPLLTGAAMDFRRHLLTRGFLKSWLCETDGTLRFHTPTGPVAHSALCPDFPASIPG